MLLACVAEVPADTAAQSVLPTVVAGEDLTRANGRVVGAQVLGNDFAGAPLAGVLVTVLPAAVLGAPGILYGVAGVLLLACAAGSRPGGRRRGRWPGRSPSRCVTCGRTVSCGRWPCRPG
ncbi:hypothetical protein AB0J42_10000 [Nonomuraea sp. NPDC049649]|uniref:hypothetical protein n=1 Tax=Nonomuraea sp. NPDC049649 TaxID=3155776 RepID=UPI003416E3E1